ncbi:FlgD Ig-like domain protein [Candidatus Methanoperedenaceae archaeon GB50]|nr:FlgD Ig-like domain protein [Candidatus Methanoperedenaceae archaeon GB50]
MFVHIYDTNGNLVTTLELKNQKAGEQKLEWDGKDDKGNSLGSGQYSFEIEAYGADEKRIDVISYIQREVTGVTYEENIVYLLLGEQKIAISDVIEIKKNETYKRRRKC